MPVSRCWSNVPPIGLAEVSLNFAVATLPKVASSARYETSTPSENAQPSPFGLMAAALRENSVSAAAAVTKSLRLLRRSTDFEETSVTLVEVLRKLTKYRVAHSVPTLSALLRPPINDLTAALSQPASEASSWTFRKSAGSTVSFLRTSTPALAALTRSGQPYNFA